LIQLLGLMLPPFFFKFLIETREWRFETPTIKSIARLAPTPCGTSTFN
jgi:hypothetical protein